jgi:hypothetical protein
MSDDNIISVYAEDATKKEIIDYMMTAIDINNPYVKKLISADSSIKIKKCDTDKRKKIKREISEKITVNREKAVAAVSEIINNEKSISRSPSVSSISSSITNDDIKSISKFIIDKVLEKKLKETEKKETLERREFYYKLLIVLLPLLTNFLQFLISYYTSKNIISDSNF